MNSVEKFNSVIKIAEHWVGRHDARRDFEWKVTLGLWALILSAIAYRERLHWPVYKCVPILPLTSAVVFALYYVLWLRPLWVRNVMDRDQAFEAIREAKKILADETYTPLLRDHSGIQTSWRRFVTDWSMLFQASATAILLTLFCILGRSSN